MIVRCLETVLVRGLDFWLESPCSFNQTKRSEIRITGLYAGGVISDGDRLASGLTPTFRGGGKVDLATSGLDCP